MVDITKLPFTEYIGLQRADKNEFIFTFPDEGRYQNHIKTVHAGVQFTLAESASGQCLLDTFAEYPLGSMLSVVRSVEAKYKKPAKGAIFAKAAISAEMAAKVREHLENKGRALAEVGVQVIDSEQSLALVAKFSWYIQKVD